MAPFANSAYLSIDNSNFGADFLWLIRPGSSFPVSWIDRNGQLGGNLLNGIPSGGGAYQFTPPLSTVAGTISGACNGSNVTFTLSSAPTTPAALQVIVSGVWQLQGSGVGYSYSISGNVITFVTPPPNGGFVAAF